MLRTFCVFALFILLPSSLLAQGGAPAALMPDASACKADGWSALEPLAGVPEGRSMRWPSAAVWGERVTLAANVVPTDGAALMDERPFVLFDVGGARDPGPAGDFQFIFPRGVYDAAGRYHLVWAESAERQRHPVMWPGPMQAALWHAVRVDGRWSPPEEILRSARLDWGAEDTPVATDARGRLHVMVPTHDARGRFALAHLRLAEGAWAVTELRLPVAYVALTAFGGDSLAAVFVGPDLSVARDGNSVFTLRSADGGATWAPPSLVSRSGDRRATWPLVHRQVDGTLHLVWAQNLTGGLDPQVVRRVSSTDGGASWRGAPDVHLPGDHLLRLSLADGGDAPVLLAESILGERLVLHELGWREGRPVSTPIHPETHLLSSVAAATVGRCTRVFGTAVPSPASKAAAVTFHTGTPPPTR